MRHTPKIVAARAAADRQLAHVDGGVDELVATARALLRTQDRTDTWAQMAVRVAARLDCADRRPQFAVEMLVAAVLRLAEQPDPDPAEDEHDGSVPPGG